MVIHGVAPSPRALGEEDSLFQVRVEGELERDGSREHLTGVRDRCCRWWRRHALIFDATCDMSWGDTDVVDDPMPAPILTDDVVMLRPLATNDAPAWLAGEDEEQRRWFEAPRPSQLDDVQRFIAECQTSWRTMGSLRHWGIWSLDPHVLVGGVELRALENHEVNLSYLVFPGQRRRGFAFRAARLALEYARTSLGAQAVVIKMLKGNDSSRNVALALGAHYVGDELSDGGATFNVFRLRLHDTPREE